MPTEILDLSLAYNTGATCHWAVRSYANAHISTDVPNATMFGITDGPGFSCGTFAGMRVCGTRDAGGVYNNYDLHFATHWGGVVASTVMTMTCGGRVGIGTSSPNTLFEVSATTREGSEISAFTSNTGGGVSSKFSFWRNYSVGGGGAFRAAYIANFNADDSNNSNNTQHLLFATKNGTAEPVERMRITSTGVIGINTSSPNNHQGVPGLTVSGTSGNRGIIEVWDGTSGKSIFQQVGGDTYIGQLCKGTGAGDLYMLTGGNGTAANVSMILKCNGNIGVGTSSPLGILDIQGNYADNAVTIKNTNASYYSSIGYKDNGGTTRVAMGWGNGSTNDFATCKGYIYTAANIDFVHFVGTAVRSFICSTNGNMGIGTITPGSYKLNVNGAFYAAGSSCEYKTQICQYNTDSCMFMKLTPVTYQYKNEYCHLGKELKSGTQIGLIAEDVAEVYPELAILKDEDNEKIVRNVDYEKLSIVLLSEVQKLRKELDELKTK